MTIIPLNEHPANRDQSARIVAEDRAGSWTVYAVTGGFVLTLDGLRAYDGIFTTQAEATQVVDDLYRSIGAQLRIGLIA